MRLHKCRVSVLLFLRALMHTRSRTRAHEPCGLEGTDAAHAHRTSCVQELNVPTEPSDMSFSVSLASRTFEWSSGGVDALFATRANAASPAFYAFLRDLARFNKCVGAARGAVAPTRLRARGVRPCVRVQGGARILEGGGRGRDAADAHHARVPG